MTDIMELADDYARVCGDTPIMPTPVERALWTAKIEKARDALQAALVQQQEPVAWLVQYDDETRSGSFATMSLDDAELYCAEDKEIVPLYLAPTIPEGWVLVPKEPTQEMLDAGDMFNQGRIATRLTYKALLAAVKEPKA